MAQEPKAGRNPYADIAPALGAYTEKILFGDVWKRAGLSARDRSLITVATLVALRRTRIGEYRVDDALPPESVLLPPS